MTDNLGTHLHFRCSFDLRAAPDVVSPWSKLVKSIRHWVEQSPQKSRPITNSAYYGAWFFLGGKWRAPRPGYHLVKTARFKGDGADRSPEFWALRYEHSGESGGRTWCTDVGVSQIADGLLRLSVLVSHHMREGYIGKEPPAPLPTAPRLVRWLLDSSEWDASAGPQRVTPQPIVLKEGEGAEIRQILGNPNRACPTVLVSRDFNSGSFLIEPRLLSEKLIGSAVVYASESTNLDRELEWCLGRFSCWNGMIRVYQPGLRFNAPGDARRHRYFSGRHIVEHGKDDILEMLVQGIVRRARVVRPRAVTTIDDIASIARERRMDELKAEFNGKHKTEWVELLEETNEELERTNRAARDEIDRLTDENADLDETVYQIRSSKRALERRADDLECEMKHLRQRAKVGELLEKLPGSMQSAVGLIARIHPDRIAFTDRAIQSAGVCKFGRINEAWSCLWAMATTLYDLFFWKRSPLILSVHYLIRVALPLP